MNEEQTSNQKIKGNQIKVKNIIVIRILSKKESNDRDLGMQVSKIHLFLFLLFEITR